MSVYPPHRRALVVLGMHRSGTSALTRVANLLGAALPSQLLAHDPSYPAETNELGFWEGVQIVDINNSFLRAVGSEWNDTAQISDATFRSDLAMAVRQKIVTHLEEEFADAPLFVLKDPRISRLAPLWVDALRAFGAEPTFLIAVRNPLEVADSLLKRNGMGRGHANLLWLRYVLDAERHTRNYRRSFISYAALLQNWRGEARRIGRECGLDWPRFNVQAELEIDWFISSDRRHNIATVEQLSTLPPWMQTTYEALDSATGGEPFDVAGIDGVRDYLDGAQVAFDRYVRELEMGMRDHAGRSRREAESLQHERQRSERLQHQIDILKAETDAAATQSSAAYEDLKGELQALCDALAVLPEGVHLATRVDDIAGTLAQLRYYLLEQGQRERAREQERVGVEQHLAELEASLSVERQDAASREAHAKSERDRIEKEGEQLRAEGAQALQDLRLITDRHDQLQARLDHSVAALQAAEARLSAGEEQQRDAERARQQLLTQINTLSEGLESQSAMATDLSRQLDEERASVVQFEAEVINLRKSAAMVPILRRRLEQVVEQADLGQAQIAKLASDVARGQEAIGVVEQSGLKVADLERELTRLRGEAKLAAVRAADFEAQLISLQNERATFLLSRSWRLTKPFRFVRRRVLPPTRA